MAVLACVLPHSGHWISCQGSNPLHGIAKSVGIFVEKTWGLGRIIVEIFENRRKSSEITPH